MQPYFSKFPKAAYDMAGDGTDIRVVTDLIHRAKFRNVVRANSLIFYPYVVKEGETPEIIAAKIYGSSQFHWIVLYCNDIMNRWTDWTLDYYQFQEFLKKKYGSIETSQTTIDHYEDKLGAFIDWDTYNATVSDGSIIVYAFDYEVTLNENKKQIGLLDPKYVNRVAVELDNLLTPAQ